MNVNSARSNALHGPVRSMWTRAAGLGGALLLGAALTACSSHPAAPVASAPTPTVAPSASPTGGPSTAPAPSSSPTQTASAPATDATHPSGSPTPVKKSGGTKTAGFSAAQAEWKKGADADSASQGSYWAKAAADLKAGEATDAGDTSFYPHAITTLKSLIAIPNTMVTPAQRAEGQADVKTLDGFFQTPGLYQN